MLENNYLKSIRYFTPKNICKLSGVKKFAPLLNLRTLYFVSLNSLKKFYIFAKIFSEYLSYQFMFENRLSYYFGFKFWFNEI